MRNYVGLFFEKLKSIFRSLPWVSTWFAALFLSGLWTLVWLIVFFSSTWLFDLSTTASVFVNIFWLSVAAEALIRWAENTNFVAALAKPHQNKPRGDNTDYRLPRAVILTFSSLILMFVLDKYQNFSGFRGSLPPFAGQNGIHSNEAIWAMLVHWNRTLADYNVLLPIALGTFLRACIYKRSHEKTLLTEEKNRNG